MAKDRKKLQHIHSSIPDKQPTAASLEVGEIAVNNAKDQEFLSIKNSNDKVVRFSSDEQMVTIMEKKEVIPYSGAVDNVHLDTNRSNIEIKLNQVVAGNTVKHDVVNGAKDIDGNLVNPTSDSGLTNGAGFAIDMSRYAMIGANPSFSSITVTHCSNLSGSTNISDGAGGSVLNITTTDVNANDTNWAENITNKAETITNRTTQVGSENLTVTGITTELHTGNVSITNSSDVTENTNGNVVINTTGTTTETNVGHVTENNKANYTVNTTSVTEMNSTGNTCINSQATAALYGKVKTNVGLNCASNASAATTNVYGTTINEKANTANTTINLANATIGTANTTVTSAKTDINTATTNVTAATTTISTANTTVGTANTNITSATTTIGNNTFTVTGFSTETINGNHTENNGSNLTVNTSGTTTINNTGKTTINVTNGTEINSCSSITINTDDFKVQQCGTNGKAEIKACQGIALSSKNISLTDGDCGNGQVTIDTNDLCLVGDSKVNLYGDETNVGIDCDGTPSATTTNIYGKTINEKADTVTTTVGTANTTVITKADITAATLNLSGNSLTINETGDICVSSQDDAAFYGKKTTKLGVACDGSVTSSATVQSSGVTNVYGPTVNFSGTTNKNTFKTINQSGDTYNVTANTSVNVSTSAACITASDKINLGGDVTTNIGSDCDGKAFSNVTNIYSTSAITVSSQTINNSATTINNTVKNENHNVSNFTVNATSAVCVVSNDKINIGGKEETNVGSDCGGDSNSNITNIYADSAVTINTPTTIIEGDVIICGNTKTDCIVSDGDLNLGSENTNIGFNCDGEPVSTKTTIYGDMTEITAGTATTEARSVNIKANGTDVNGRVNIDAENSIIEKAPSINMSGNTLSIKAKETLSEEASYITSDATGTNGVNYVHASKYVQIKSGNIITDPISGTGVNIKLDNSGDLTETASNNACYIANNKSTLYGKNSTNVGVSCDGSVTTTTTNVKGVTVNISGSTHNVTATTNISGNTNITGDTKITKNLNISGNTTIGGDLKINIPCDEITAGTVNEALCELLTRGEVSVTGSSRNNDNASNTFQSYTIRQNDTDKEVKVEIANVKTSSAQTTSPQGDSTYRTFNVSYSGTSRGGVAIPNVTITSTTEGLSANVLKQYDIMYDGVSRGKIDIPKDLLVKSGSTKIVTQTNVPYQGAAIGDKYIELDLNVKDGTPTSGETVYIPAKDLVVDSVYQSNRGTLIASTTYDVTSGVQVVNYDVNGVLRVTRGTPNFQYEDGLNYAEYNGSKNVPISIPSDINHLSGITSLEIKHNNVDKTYKPNSSGNIVANLEHAKLHINYGGDVTNRSNIDYNTYGDVDLYIPTSVSGINRSTLNLSHNSSTINYDPGSSDSIDVLLTHSALTLTYGATSGNSGSVTYSTVGPISASIPTSVCHLNRGSLTLKQGSNTLGTYDPCSDKTIIIPEVVIPAPSAVTFCYADTCNLSGCGITYDTTSGASVTIPATISHVTCGDIVDENAGTASAKITATGKNIKINATGEGGTLDLYGYSAKLKGFTTNVDGMFVSISGESNVSIDAVNNASINVTGGTFNTVASNTTMMSLGSASIAANGNVSVKSSGGEVSIDSGNNAQYTHKSSVILNNGGATVSGNVVSIYSEGNAEIKADSGITVSGQSNVALKSSDGKVSVNSKSGTTINSSDGDTRVGGKNVYISTDINNPTKGVYIEGFGTQIKGYALVIDEKTTNISGKNYVFIDSDSRIRSKVGETKEEIDRSGFTWTSSGHNMTWNGECLVVDGCVQAKNMYQTSDERLKENILNVDIEKARASYHVPIKQFNFKDDESKRTVYGVIAQEAENFGLNELIHENEDGFKSVDYTSLLLLKIAYLEDKYEVLRHKYDNLAERLENLENK